MVFSSLTYLFYFLPAMIVVYALVPHKLKNLVMIVASFVFYAWGEVRFIPIMLALSVIDFVFAKQMEKHRNNKRKRKIALFISVGSNLAVLIFFKYFNFIASNILGLLQLDFQLMSIVLPIGVSFNSFQSISYAIDVYRDTTKPEEKYYNYLAYTTLFPQIIAGPIVRYVTVEDDLDDHLLTVDSFTLGMKRFILGLAKKVLIANNVGLLWSQISSMNVYTPSVLLFWLGIIAYGFQIYFDFSGYSDMAIGLARIFGLSFDENFNYPYIAKSITEFWRRWHITLGAWFRDYVYIPLGGNRGSKATHLRNLLIVWSLTGLWHGASWNFMIWGLYFALLLIIEKYFLGVLLKKIPTSLQHGYTLILVLTSWIIFYFEDFSMIGYYLKGLFGFGSMPLVNNEALYVLTNYIVIFLIAAICSIPIYHRLTKILKPFQSNVTRWSTSFVYVILFLISVAYLVDSTYNPFLYFRF